MALANFSRVAAKQPTSFYSDTASQIGKSSRIQYHIPDDENLFSFRPI